VPLIDNLPKPSINPPCRPFWATCVEIVGNFIIKTKATREGMKVEWPFNSDKYHLSLGVENIRITSQELSTIVIRIEAWLHSRTLCPLTAALKFSIIIKLMYCFFMQIKNLNLKSKLRF